MVKYGLQFQDGLAGLHADIRAWAHVDYIYYKHAIKVMLGSVKNDPCQLTMSSDFSGEGGEKSDSVRELDATFRRSLLADIADVDECFAAQCLALRAKVAVLSNDEDVDVITRLDGRKQLLELHRWAVLNYLAVLKIVKKHDKSGVLYPLRAEVIDSLGRCSFVQALETPSNKEASSEHYVASTSSGGDGEESDAAPHSPSSRPTRSNPYGRLADLLPPTGERELQAVLREIASEKYHPSNQLRHPQPEEPLPPIPASDVERVLRTFGATYLGYASLLAAKRPLTVCKHAFAADLQLSPRTLGLIDSAQMAGFAVGSLLIVPSLASRASSSARSAIALLAASLLSAGACVALCAIQSGDVPLVLLGGGLGLASSWSYPMCMALLNQVMPAGRRSRLMGAWGTTGALGNMAGSFVSLRGLRILGWRWTFALPAALVSTAGLIVLSLLRTVPRERDDTILASAREAPPPRDDGAASMSRSDSFHAVCSAPSSDATALAGGASSSPKPARPSPPAGAPTISRRLSAEALTAHASDSRSGGLSTRCGCRTLATWRRRTACSSRCARCSPSGCRTTCRRTSTTMSRPQALACWPTIWAPSSAASATPRRSTS